MQAGPGRVWEAAVEHTPIGESIALVLRLHEAADGQWLLHVDGTNVAEVIPLAPATLVVQLWRSSNTKVLRGTIQLHGSQHTATIQGNMQLVELIRAWLLPKESGARDDQDLEH
jgi:hypothetical protein